MANYFDLLVEKCIKWSKFWPSIVKLLYFPIKYLISLPRCGTRIVFLNLLIWTDKFSKLKKIFFYGGDLTPNSPPRYTFEPTFTTSPSQWPTKKIKFSLKIILLILLKLSTIFFLFQYLNYSLIWQPWW